MYAAVIRTAFSRARRGLRAGERKGGGDLPRKHRAGAAMRRQGKGALTERRASERSEPANV